MTTTKHLLLSIQEVEEGLSRGKTLDVICREIGISPSDYHHWKKNNKRVKLHVSIGNYSLPKEIILEKRNWFKNDPDVSVTLSKASKLGVDPEKIIDLCIKAYYSKGKLERYQIEGDLGRLRRAVKVLKKTSLLLKNKPGESWALTEWTIFKLKAELTTLESIQSKLACMADNLTSFSKTVNFPKNRPQHWEDVSTVVDMTSGNTLHYLSFKSRRAKELILKLATLFRHYSKNKGPNDLLSLEFVSKIMNANSKKPVQMDLESYSKMRREVEKNSGIST